MRILFINFNMGATPGINNGLAILSGILKERGHEVGLLFICEDLDYDFDLLRMRNDIIDFNPDIIGVSLMEPQFKYFKDFCNDLRDYYRGFVVCGGPYPTMAPEEVISVEGINAVCVGEGDDAILELVETLGSGGERSDIKNLWFRLSDGTIIRNKLRPFKDLDELPLEDKELFDLNKILPIKNYQLEVLLGRGCAYRCSYCINWSYIKRYQDLCEKVVGIKDYIRMKKVDTVISEIKDSISRYPQIKKIAFIDDNFLIYSNYLKDFFKEYKRQIHLPFMCNVTPASYGVSKARILKESGCDDVRFGVESGSERIKKDILRRPISNRTIINAFKINRELEMMTSSFNMIGLPTETKDEILETLKLNAIIMPETVKVMTFYPFRNTPIYDLCEQLNLIDYDKKYELDNYDTFTCLKFPPAHHLLLRKVQTAFNWYINAFLDNGASSKYGELIRDIEKMNEEEWGEFDFYAVDEEVSKELRKRGVLHYSKFVNRSLAVRYPSGHFN